MKSMKSILRVIMFPLAASIAFASFAFGDGTTKTTHDVSKNPLTGNTTETTTTESHSNVADATKKTKHTRRKKYNKARAKIKDESETTSEVHQ